MKQLRILAVEDNPADLRLLMEYLREDVSLRSEIVSAGTLKEALKHLLSAGDFAAVLLDLNLPDSHGLEGLEKIIGIRPMPAVIVLTGSDDEKTGLLALSKGAQDYLVKGKISGDALVRSIRYSIERNKAEESVRKLSAELEERVKVRTAELVTANEQLQHEAMERKRVQDVLVEQSQILDTFFRHTLTPLVFLDCRFNFIRVNEAYARACQKDVSEFPGRNHFVMYPNEENRRIFEDVVKTKKPYQVFAKPFSFPDHPEWGVTYWDWTLVPLLDADGGVEHLVFSLEDVTERKKAEQALEASEEKYRQLVENANSVILRLDTAGRIVFVNEYGLKFFGYRENELLGQAVTETIVPKTESTGRDLRMLLEEIHRNPDQYANNVNENIRKDGSRVWVAWTNKSVRDDEGRLVETLCVGVDITERRRLEQERQRLAEQLIALQEMERKNISSMLHDHMGQLLTVARLDLESLKLKEPGSQETISRVLEWLKEIIETVRNMAISLRPPLLDDMSVEAALESLVENFGKAAHLKAVFKAEKRLPALDAETKTCFYRVLQEALTNIGKHARASIVEIIMTVGDGKVNMTVHDDGAGFEPAVTGKGIGLVSMRERVRQMDGQFRVRSALGQGTTLSVEIPVRRKGKNGP